jgi:hypothetical protein
MGYSTLLQGSVHGGMSNNMNISFLSLSMNEKSRPKEHHVFHVLHWIKAAFKKHALDGIKEADCSSKEAFRFVHFFTAWS